MTKNQEPANNTTGESPFLDDSEGIGMDVEGANRDVDGHLRYLLSAYLFGDISASGRAEVDEHLAICQECRKELEELRRTLGILEDVLQDDPVQYSFDERRRERVLGAAAERRFRIVSAIARNKILLSAASCFFMAVVGLLYLVVVKTGPAGVRWTPQELVEEGYSTSLGADRSEAGKERPQYGALKNRVSFKKDMGGRNEEGPSALERPEQPDSAVVTIDALAEEVTIDALAEEYGLSGETMTNGFLSMRTMEEPATMHFTEESPLTSDIAGAEFAIRTPALESHHLAERSGRGSLAPEITFELLDSEEEAFDSDEDSPIDSFTDTLPGKMEPSGPHEGPLGAKTVARNDSVFRDLSSLRKLRKALPESEQSLGSGGSATSPVRSLDELVTTVNPNSPDSRVASETGRGLLLDKEQLLHDNQALTADEAFLRSYQAYEANDSQLNVHAFARNRLAVPAPEIGDEGLGREEFRRRYGINPFVDTRRDNVSTFAMDVDTASFTRAQAELANSQLPSPKSIRVEEFVNYFPQNYVTHPEEVFSVACDGMPTPFGREEVELLRVGIKARDLRADERRNVVLTFAIDVSGSMSDLGRLETVKSSMDLLLDSLLPTDLVSVTTYADEATLVLPHTPVRQKDRIRGVLGSILPRGATNVEAGLDLAYRVAHDALSPGSLNRVILVSDGVANVGARGPEEILKKIKVFARKGIYLSTVGVGMGKYNDAMLERLANEGNGNYNYVANVDEAARIFRDNLPSTLDVLAQDAKIQVEFHPEGVSHYRLLGYENRDIRDVDFRNDKVDAGEVGPGSTVTALFEIVRHSGWTGSIGTVRLRYLDTRTQQVDERDFPIPQGVIAATADRDNDSLRVLACAAELAELLRESYYARDGSFSQLIQEIGKLNPVSLRRPEVQSLLDMSRQAQRLKIHSLQRWLSTLERNQLENPAASVPRAPEAAQQSQK